MSDKVVRTAKSVKMFGALLLGAIGVFAVSLMQDRASLVDGESVENLLFTPAHADAPSGGYGGGPTGDNGSSC